MERLVTQFANAEAHAAEKADLFGSLGIDWKLLILQSVAFLILLFVLSKWVYPPLAAMLDKREKDLRTAEKAAKSARENADKTEKMINASMRKARAEARDIVASARNEAAEIVEAAAKKAEARAEGIIEAARTEIAGEVAAARQALHNETLQLVAEATGTLVNEKLDAKKDGKLIEKALKEAR